MGDFVTDLEKLVSDGSLSRKDKNALSKMVSEAYKNGTLDDVLPDANEVLNKYGFPDMQINDWDADGKASTVSIGAPVQWNKNDPSAVYIQLMNFAELKNELKTVFMAGACTSLKAEVKKDGTIVCKTP